MLPLLRAPPGWKGVGSVGAVSFSYGSRDGTVLYWTVLGGGGKDYVVEIGLFMVGRGGGRVWGGVGWGLWTRWVSVLVGEVGPIGGEGRGGLSWVVCLVAWWW